MGVVAGLEPITQFEQWYEDYRIDERRDCLGFQAISAQGAALTRRYEDYKREMDGRVTNHWKLELLADNEVISPKPDLPNVSSGETAGLVRRVARNLVQNTPNVDVVCEFDDDSAKGILARHILMSKIIGVDEYSNDMQQNLFSSTKMSFTLGFDCVIPVLLQDATRSWYIKYDTIHYRDVFPEPGCKDIRQSAEVFVRRYLTPGDVQKLIRSNAPGWDINALKLLLQNSPPAREAQSVDQQTRKNRTIPSGYEIITWYNSYGDHFLTFAATSKILLRIEQNKHPRAEHPVHFLVLEKDGLQPLGKSQVELILGRQDFQDLMLNGAMKLWYRNINPTILGYGTANAVPNLGPGKFTQISNPNAKIEAFEVNTQTLLQYGQISQQNLGSMVNLVGSADQQMATQAGNGMSATPQGVDAQQQMVDITTNNYQKAIESFFSHYCSYALTIYFQELKSVKNIVVTAETRKQLLSADYPEQEIDEENRLTIDFEDLAVEYFVRCVPGSLVEMEDEKQLRILNQLFVPLSQAMPALAASQDQDMLRNAAQAMQFIISKEIELSGSAHARGLKEVFTGNTKAAMGREQRIDEMENRISGMHQIADQELELNSQAIVQLQQQMSQMVKNQQLLLEKLGISNSPSEGEPNNLDGASPEEPQGPATVGLASA